MDKLLVAQLVNAKNIVQQITLLIMAHMTTVISSSITRHLFLTDILSL